MTVTVRSMAAGRQGCAGAASESSYPDPQTGSLLNGTSLFRPQSLLDTPPPTKPLLLILPKQFSQLGIKYSNISLRDHSKHHSVSDDVLDSVLSLRKPIYEEQRFIVVSELLVHGRLAMSFGGLLGSLVG